MKTTVLKFLDIFAALRGGMKRGNHTQIRAGGTEEFSRSSRAVVAVLAQIGLCAPGVFLAEQTSLLSRAIYSFCHISGKKTFL
jgi:hypothetical protein